VTTPEQWRALCGLALQLVGSQEKFRRESNCLKRLVKQYGAKEVSYMLRGAILLKWNSLLSLGSAEGSGRRKAREAFWNSQKKAPAKLPESVRTILKRMIDA
jgi:hypothetical protein